jgi:hypothetical protein
MRTASLPGTRAFEFDEAAGWNKIADPDGFVGACARRGPLYLTNMANCCYHHVGPMFALLALVGLGCGSTTYTETGGARAPKDDDCQFVSLTAPPQQAYHQLGVVDVKPGKEINKLDEFQDYIRPYVCQAGGDAAIVLPNGDGNYIKATVIAMK